MAELSRTYRVLCVFIGIGFTFFGVLGLNWSLAETRRGRESLRWPRADGEVVSADIKYESTNRSTGKKRYGLTVTYRYTVEEVLHRGSRYSFSNTAGSGSMEECRKLAAGYPVGGRVEVSYDPDCPGESVLHPGADRSNYLFSGLMATLLVGGLALIGAFLVRPLLRTRTPSSSAAERAARSLKEGAMHFYFAPGKAIGFCAFGLALSGLGALVLWLADSGEVFTKVVAAALLFFGALVIAITLRQMLRPGPVLSLSPEGIDYRRLNVGPIPWAEIDTISLTSAPTVAAESVFLSLTLKNPDKYLSRLSSLQRRLVQINEKTGYGQLAISFTGLNPGLEEAWSYIVDVLKPEVIFEGEDSPEEPGKEP